MSTRRARRRIALVSLVTGGVVVTLIAVVASPRPGPTGSPSPGSPAAHGSAAPTVPPLTTRPPLATPLPGATDDQPLPDCPSDLVPVRQAPFEPEAPRSGDVTLGLVAQMGGPPAAVLLGDRALVGVGGRLAELDAADPAAGSIATSAAIADRITALADAGDEIAVGLGREGLAVLDSTSLSRMSSLPLPGYAESVVVADALAFVADGPGGLRIVDIGNPAQPVEVGHELALHRVMDVAVAGELAFVAAADEGLFVLDVADPTQPRELSRLYTGGYAFALEHTAGRLVVADGWTGVALVDVDDPAAPSVVANVATTGWAMDVALDGDRAAVAAGNELLLLAGVAAGRLDEVGRVALPAGRAEKVDLDGGLVALADQSAGVTFYDADAGQPLAIGAFDPLTRASGLELVGDRAFVAALGQGLRVIDIGDPDAPVEEPPIIAVDSVNTVTAVAGSVLFTTVPLEGSPYAGSLHTLGAPERVVSMNVPHGLWLDADGSLLFAAAEQEVLIISAASGEAACLLGRLATKDFETGAGLEANDISVVGDTAFVAGYYDEIHVVDVSTPREPALVEAQPRMGGLGVGQLLAIGSTLYTLAADPDGQLMAIFDVSDRAEPRVIGRVRLPAETGRQDASGPTLAFGAGYVFVADGTAGLVAIDVSDPRRPSIAGRLALPGDAVAVAARGEHVYVTTDGGAFFVAKVEPAPAVAASPYSADPRTPAQPSPRPPARRTPLAARSDCSSRSSSSAS